VDSANLLFSVALIGFKSSSICIDQQRNSLRVWHSYRFISLSFGCSFACEGKQYTGENVDHSG